MTHCDDFAVPRADIRNVNAGDTVDPYGGHLKCIHNVGAVGMGDGDEIESRRRNSDGLRVGVGAPLVRNAVAGGENDVGVGAKHDRCALCGVVTANVAGLCGYDTAKA